MKKYFNSKTNALAKAKEINRHKRVKKHYKVKYVKLEKPYKLVHN